MLKWYALGTLAGISLLVPAAEVAITGRIEAFGRFGIAQVLASVAAIYWWYHLDKKQQQYTAGPLMNVGVAGLAVIALPIYFFRSRGWKRGALATMAVLGVVIIVEILGEVGALLGREIAP